uniref:Lipase, member Ib n=1 Tax=Hucho hucho TaxID=62062 RepID=A0A4W5KRI8_9TELE
MLLWRLFGLMGFLMLCKGQDSGVGALCDDFTDLDFHECFLGTTLNVKLLLYTKYNLRCGRELNHHQLSSQPLFNLSLPMAFVIHGYRPTGAPPFWVDHVVQLLSEQEDMNVLVVDWNRGAANLNYFTAVTNTRQAANNLTGFILNMQAEGVPLSSVHLIGSSLGAHLAGFVGANLKGKIGRITGLDPAGPMFTGATPEERLDPSDAMFVDVLHTDINWKSYFMCDHQRSVFLYLCALNRTCSLTAYPCSSYSDFLDGRCLQCEAFKPAPCPMLGYDVSRWRDILLRLGQTKVYFTTTATLPYKKVSYRVDMVTWNRYPRWGVLILRLHSGRNFTEARIDRKLFRFEQYTSTRLLVQFDEDLQPIQKISLSIATRNVIGPRYKIRLIRIHLTPLEQPDRPLMCRYDIIMEENIEVAFRPLPCDPHL